MNPIRFLGGLLIAAGLFCLAIFPPASVIVLPGLLLSSLSRRYGND